MFLYVCVCLRSHNCRLHVCMLIVLGVWVTLYILVCVSIYVCICLRSHIRRLYVCKLIVLGEWVTLLTFYVSMCLCLSSQSQLSFVCLYVDCAG